MLETLDAILLNKEKDIESFPFFSMCSSQSSPTEILRDLLVQNNRI